MQEIIAYQIFQPTPSARRVTLVLLAACLLISISTHTLRKEGDHSVDHCAVGVTDISTHTLRKEGDAEMLT